MCVELRLSEYKKNKKLIYFFKKCMSASILNPQREKVAMTVYSCIMRTFVIYRFVQNFSPKKAPLRFRNRSDHNIKTDY